MVGVSWVVNFPVPDGLSPQQSLDMLQSRINDFGAKDCGTFTVDCATYQSGQQMASKTLHLLHSSYQPSTSFVVTDTGLCVTADVLFDVLVQKLKHNYLPRKNLSIECRGQIFTAGDFVIRLGSIYSSGGVFKGILLEALYKPCTIPADCTKLMKEFLQQFVGASLLEAAAQRSSSQDTAARPEDSVLQYLQHFNTVRALNQRKP